MVIEEQEKRLRRLVDVFLEENRKINLSAMRDSTSIWIGSVLDSLAALDVLDRLFPHPPAGAITILDVGTGGGFPLLPLAICREDCAFTGLDSVGKKLDAIRRMADHLELNNVTLINGRAEELGRDPQYRDRFNVVTARALAPLNVLLEYCAPFVKPGGYLVAWKSMKIDTELSESLLARAELSCTLADTYIYDLDETGLPAVDPAKRGGGWGKRQLLMFEKRAKTDAKYPREVGLPKKKPLV